MAWHPAPVRSRSSPICACRIEALLNNGVLIYVQLADQVVEIVADRGFDGRVSPAEWGAVCRLMEKHFRAGRFEAGSIAGVDAIGSLLTRHYPPNLKRPAPQSRNQLP